VSRPAIVLPDRKDPRLRLAAVIVGLQILGQAGLGFKLSIAQILVSIAVCALAEVAITYRRDRVLAWPASAILTGNSTALILRANGTVHGDWWSLNGVHFFVLAALGGLLSKYLIKIGDRHLFNPSNLGLVLCLIAFGPFHVYPQYLWWGPPGPALVAVWVIILAGGVWVLSPLRMLPMVFAFGFMFASGLALLAGTQHCFTAVWDLSTVCDEDYWLAIAGSPELFVFVLFMMSDPKTAPRGALARAMYGAAVAALATVMIAFQQSEFGVKLAILGSLAAVCALVPLIEAAGARLSGRAAIDLTLRPLRWPAAASALVALLIAVTVPVLVADMGSDQRILRTDLNPSIPGSTNNQ
jgi:hypothetical protein